MVVPQGMAYSLLAGLPPIHGLYAASIPLLVFSFLGTSRVQVNAFCLVHVCVGGS